MVTLGYETFLVMSYTLQYQFPSGCEGQSIFVYIYRQINCADRIMIFGMSEIDAIKFMTNIIKR